MTLSYYGPYPVEPSGLHAIDNDINSRLHTIDDDTRPAPLWTQDYPYIPAENPVAVTPSEKSDKNEKSRVTIGGLRPLTFWLLLFLTAVIIVAASVGGAIAGAARAPLKETSGSTMPLQTFEAVTTLSSSVRSMTFITTATTTTSSTSTFSSTASSPIATAQSVAAKTPTQGVTDCPSTNGTIFTPVDPTNGHPLATKFRKICGHSFNDGGLPLVSAFVVTFDACIALCANFNFWQQKAGSDLRCTNVNYGFGGVYPNNCWASNISISLKVDQFWDAAQIIL